MKKISSLLPTILILGLITLTNSSCSRKFGCYYSQTSELKPSGFAVATYTDPKNADCSSYTTPVNLDPAREVAGKE